MPTSAEPRNIALVYGTLPVVDEILHIQQVYNRKDHITIVTTIELGGYIRDMLPEEMGLEFIELPDHSDDLTFIPGLEKALLPFDLVIVKERLGFYAYQAVKAMWNARFKLIYWIDNITPFPAQDIERLNTIREAVENSADGFMVSSNAAYKMLRDIEGVSEERLYKLPPYSSGNRSADGQGKANARRDLGIAESKFVISHIAQLEWEEGVLDLLHGAKMANLTHPELSDRLQFLICGIGSFSHEIRRRVMKLGLEAQVKIISPSATSLERVWKSSDCVFHSSIQSRDRLEGDPYRFIAPMANKLPILAGRSILVEEFVGKHRIDFCIGSSQSLAKAIVKATKAKGLCKDIVQKNLDKIQSKFTIEQAKEKFERTLQKVLGQEESTVCMEFPDALAEVEKLVKDKKYLDAVNRIERLFANPQLPLHHLATALRLVGDCFTKLNDLPSAIESYEKALEIDPYCPKVYIGIGTVELVKEKYDSAMLAFQKAVAFAPEDAMALLGLGLSFQGLEEFDESTRWVCLSLDVQPENTAAIFTIVRNANATAEYSEAIKVLEKYLLQHPLDLELIFTLSAIYFKCNDLVSSEKWVMKIIEIDKNNKRALQLLASIKSSKAAIGTMS